MREEINVDQVVKDSDGRIVKIIDESGRVYNNDEVLHNMQKDRIIASKEGQRSQENFKNLLEKGVEFEREIDSDILKDLIDRKGKK